MNVPNEEDEPAPPIGIDHVVLRVRDLEASHRFWCDDLGLRHVGTSRRIRDDGLPSMRFYSGSREGRPSHHHVGLWQVGAEAFAGAQKLDHVAIRYPDEAAWLARIALLERRGVPLFGRVHRGAAHSISVRDPDGGEIELLYQRPRAEWKDDIDGALNRAVRFPVAG